MPKLPYAFRRVKLSFSGVNRFASHQLAVAYIDTLQFLPNICNDSKF